MVFMRKLCLALLLIFVFSAAKTQEKITRLRNELKMARQDTARARLCGLLAWELKFSNSQEALSLANTEIELARKQKNDALLSDGFRVKALTLVIRENIVEGMLYYDSALIHARRARNLELEASCYSLMAGMYGDHADFDKAIDLYTKGYRIAVKSQSPKMIATLSNNLAEAYQSVGRNTLRVQEYFDIALKNSLKINDTENAAMNSANLALEFATNNENEKANHELKRSIELMYKKRTDPYRFATTGHVVAYAFMKLGYIREAEKYALASVHIMDSLQRPDNVLRPLLVLTEIYVSTGNTPKAHYYAEMMLDRAKQQHAKFYLREAYKALYDVAKKDKNYQEALNYFELYKSWNDSVFKTEREKSIAQVELESALAQKELEVKFKTEKRIAENKNLKNQNAVLESRQLIIFLACIVFSILITLLYFANRRKKKAYIALEAEKKIVEQQAIEKGALVHEIHHRVKNNLTMLKSLLYLQAKASQQPETKRILEECQARILSMSLVHQNLYEENEKSSIDFHVFLEDMFRELSISFLQEGKKIAFEVTGAKTEMGLVQGVPIALIINEFVTNSLKYAFKEKPTGKIGVEIVVGESKTTIRYFDTGPGLPTGYSSDKGGFGFKLIHILIRQLNASLQYEKSNHASTYILQIPQR